MRHNLQHQEILITAQLYETFVFPPLSSGAMVFLSKDGLMIGARVGYACCQVVIQSFLLQFNMFELFYLCFQYKFIEKQSIQPHQRSNELLISVIPIYFILGYVMTISPIFLLHDVVFINLSAAIVSVLLANLILLFASLNFIQFLHSKDYFAKTK